MLCTEILLGLHESLILAETLFRFTIVLLHVLESVIERCEAFFFLELLLGEVVLAHHLPEVRVARFEALDEAAARGARV